MVSEVAKLTLHIKTNFWRMMKEFGAVEPLDVQLVSRDSVIGGSMGDAGAPLALPTGSNSFAFAYISAKNRLHQRSAPPMGNPGSATECNVIVM